MRKPRILIPVPTSFDPAYNEKSWGEYAQAVLEAGGEPIKGELAVPLPAVDGYLLTGSGADVEPLKYGQERDPACGRADSFREVFDRRVFEAVEKAGTPLLTICFGTQSLNVHRGGTLIQDLAQVPVNHPAGRSVIVAHTVKVAPDSLLAEMVDRQEAQERDGFLVLPVNSSHHQAIAIPGDGLRVSARSSEDAVVECVEKSDGGPFLLAVQWHPERTTGTSATSRNIFKRLIEEAGKGL